MGKKVCEALVALFHQGFSPDFQAQLHVSALQFQKTDTIECAPNEC